MNYIRNFKHTENLYTYKNKDLYNYKNCVGECYEACTKIHLFESFAGSHLSKIERLAASVLIHPSKFWGGRSCHALA